MQTAKREKAFRIAIFVVLDILANIGSYYLALWLRFDFQLKAIPDTYLKDALPYVLVWSAFAIAVYALFRLYNSIWVYASVDEFFRVLAANVVLGVIGLAYILLVERIIPLSVQAMSRIFAFFCVMIIRFSYRLLRYVRNRLGDHDRGHKNNIMLIGAGEAGRVLITELESRSYSNGRVICAIDDNPAKRNRRLLGVPIVGNRYDIPKMAEKYKIETIVFAIPSCSAADKKAILHISATTGCKVQILPSIYQLVNKSISISDLREIEPKDLLGREQIQVNLDEICTYVSGKVVMVTGGGGSIGSELCRQIAGMQPKQLIIFDIYGNTTYDVQMELQTKFPELDLVVLIGSVRNTARLDYVLSTYKPELIFHAAAHKHVPLMEDSPNEAIKNNVFGTYKMAQAASKHGAKRFVLISTDKAVNPTNIMGASKRLCEMIVQMMDRESKTEFVAVRFGNVLGSNGSVIPLFKKQIASGGPVTVTHPEITRFFMTIPEAVGLVLQAGYYAKGGEIFVLDMGEPVKIDTMARNLIRLAGYEPDVDIEIKYIGLRPGEKLYEELLMEEEGLQATENKLIHIGKPIEMDDNLFKMQLARLNAAYKTEATNMKEIVAEIVPTYKPDLTKCQAK